MDYGHAEVVAVFGQDPRKYSVVTTEFRGDATGKVKSLVTMEAVVSPQGVQTIPGTEKEWPADLVILAMGFVSPEASIHSKLGLDLDQRNNILADYGEYRTNLDGVFAAGQLPAALMLI